MLLKTRSAVLRSAGYDVSEAACADDAKNLFGDSRFDALIIGHTMPEIERRKLSDMGYKNSTPVVLLCVGRDQSSTIRADVRVDCSEGPAALLDAVASLLGPQHRAATNSR
jgi:DNA-binding response OmpR family regulator